MIYPLASLPVLNNTTNNKTLANSIKRKAGYLLALSEHNIEYNPNYCLEFALNSEEKYNKLKDLLISENRPTALLIYDDIVAVSIGNLISACNLKVPEDLSIISFNNSIFARMMNPQLTSIDINAYQLGVEAASQLSKHIENPNLFATKIIVPYFLVKRESCREIR
jgi:DNA-binding LacI/PurR family transcriptional regulator